MNDTPHRILVVDDEPSITEFVSYALKKEGFFTDVVDNGEDALALATKNSYDLFVLDIMLPGMDGYELCRRLRFPQMVTDNTDNHETAFTVSVDHADTTTGISAAERGLTARKVVDPTSSPSDFRRPGHMFPLMAKPLGVLERNGHTEATVDLCRLAGL